MKVIIVGAGEVGFNIARRLSEEDHDVVVIDRDPAKIRRLSESLDVQYIRGAGSSPSILKEAGMKDADIVVAVTDSDEINIVACLFANMESEHAIKIARIRNREYLEHKRIFEKTGLSIDLVINPESEVVKSILTLLEVPGASDVIDFAGGKVRLIGLNVKSNPVLAGRKLVDFKEMTRAHPFLIAVIIRGGKTIIPGGRDTILPNDFVYLVVEEQNVANVMQKFNIQHQALKKIIIVGGGNLGFTLAEQLDRAPVKAKIIESNEARCQLLAERLNKVTVLCGDGTDKDLLMEENIQDTDAVIAVTEEEETNVLISLLARELGAKKTITSISKFSYIPLVQAIGLDAVVSPRLSAVSAILQFIRKGKVISVASLKGESAEAIEVLALETSEIVGRPIKDVGFPKGALLGAIVRGDEVFIPTGESVVKPQDRMIIFSGREAIPAVEKFLTVKMEYF